MILLGPSEVPKSWQTRLPDKSPSPPKASNFESVPTKVNLSGSRRSINGPSRVFEPSTKERPIFRFGPSRSSRVLQRADEPLKGGGD